MSTDNNKALVVVEGGARGGAMVRNEDALSFGQMMEMGDHLVRTGFLPQHIKNGAQAAAIMLTGRELGMPPMRAIRSLQMVKGKVVEDAASQLARFKSDGGRAQFKELSDERAVLWLRHPNGDEHTETFTAEDAKRAGLSGDNWQKHRKAMLRSRAITAGLKSLGWEGSVGAYDANEMDDPPSGGDGGVAPRSHASIPTAPTARTLDGNATPANDDADETERLKASIAAAKAKQPPAPAPTAPTPPPPREPGSDDDVETITANGEVLVNGQPPADVARPAQAPPNGAPAADAGSVEAWAAKIRAATSQNEAFKVLSEARAALTKEQAKELVVPFNELAERLKKKAG